MKREQLDASKYVLLLQHIVARWPKTAGQNLETSHRSLGDYLADNFDVTDLIHHIQSVAEVDRIETTSDGVVLYFHDADGHPHRAIFEVSIPDRPRLKSIKFECPACFGTGTNDGAVCLLCDGVGWGAGVTN